MTFGSLLAGYTRGEIVGSLAFACLFAMLGYRMSHRHRLARGVTPWRLPSVVWGAICFFFQPFGLVVELVAQATTKPAAPAPAAGHLSRYPGPETTVLRGAIEIDPPVAAPAGPPPPARDETGATPLFGWYADATGRHEQRYWDGRRWSEHVLDDGARGVDPV
ncbi:MAG TPA: DUF2510 domain-containing protein [Acidimicrobiales bacterium]|nr:DUF2510 domain-containing protein [Acidimicrobiales bacterium]